jgi:hypothetical protein
MLHKEPHSELNYLFFLVMKLLNRDGKYMHHLLSHSSTNFYVAHKVCLLISHNSWDKQW